MLLEEFAKPEAEISISKLEDSVLVCISLTIFCKPNVIAEVEIPRYPFGSVD